MLGKDFESFLSIQLTIRDDARVRNKTVMITVESTHESTMASKEPPQMNPKSSYGGRSFLMPI